MQRIAMQPQRAFRMVRKFGSILINFNCYLKFIIANLIINKLKTYKSLLLSLFSGLLLGLSWPTYGFSSLIFIAFVPLLYLINNYHKKFSFGLFSLIYLTFIIWNSISTGWLYYATTEGMLFAILVNSLLMTIVFSFYKIVSQKINSKLSLLFLVSLWISFEKFHLNWDFSWPWLNLGNVFSEKIGWIQWYEYTGAFGGTLWVLVINIVIYKILIRFLEKKALKKQLITVSLLLITPILISKYIYHKIDLKGDSKQFFIVQPNIDPYNEKYKKSNLDNYLYLQNLIDKNEVKNSTIILPETYFSDAIQIDSYNDNQLKKMLNDLMNKSYSEILTGIELFEIIYDSIDVKEYSNNLNDGRWLNLYNSAAFIAKKNQFYNKSKLVVGVELMPYKSFIEPILGKVLLDFGGLSYSRGYDSFRKNFKSSQGFNISPIICFESIYGEYVTEYTRKGSNLFAIITNDGWWDVSEGHKQHLSYAKLRAIENRRNIVRSANTGISAVINYKGKIIQSISYGEEGFIKSEVPLLKKITFYVKYGDYIFRISLFFLIIILLHFLATTLKTK